MYSIPYSMSKISKEFWFARYLKTILIFKTAKYFKIIKNKLIYRNELVES